MRILLAVLALCTCVSPVLIADCAAQQADGLLSLVVMDPLAAPLSCPCVEGYAQRQYDQFAAALGKRLGREVAVTFAGSLEKALQNDTCKRIDIVIGKDSVVRADAGKLKLEAVPIAQLTGKDGKTTQTGLFVVPSVDPAQDVGDLSGYRIIFGAPDCDEKFAAARNLLTQAGVPLPPLEQTEISNACSDGATLILEVGDDVRAAAVISSYAAPLLEGCGTVKKGDLRVVGTTEPVPFVTVYFSKNIPAAEREALKSAVIKTSHEPEMLQALESLFGFVPLTPEYHAWHNALEKSDDAGDTSSDWPGWRGPQRDGHCQWLPRELPAKMEVLWQAKLAREGLGGIAATGDVVIVGDRDVANLLDEFKCFAAGTGKLLWTVRYPAPGRLDYDNSPRATPLIAGERAYLFGAFGDLRCVDVQTGLVVWQKNILREFGATGELVWGTASSPLLVDGKLIVNPGAIEASLVALDPGTGSLVWKTPGGRHAYASPVVATLGGVRQLVAYDSESLGGFNPATGDRLWTLTPSVSGDFNVPTPVVVGDKLLLASENNGTRLHRFDRQGRIIAEPTATSDTLAPDMCTPVVIGERLFCMATDLVCLDLAEDLREVWTASDPAFGVYAPLIASADRLLVVGRGGELLLIDPQADELRIISRTNPLEGSVTTGDVTYAHPAVVGDRLYLRVGTTLACVSLRE